MRLEIRKVVRLSSLLSPFTVDAEKKTAAGMNKSKKSMIAKCAQVLLFCSVTVENVNINF